MYYGCIMHYKNIGFICRFTTRAYMYRRLYICSKVGLKLEIVNQHLCILSNLWIVHPLSLPITNATLKELGFDLEVIWGGGGGCPEEVSILMDLKMVNSLATMTFNGRNQLVHIITSNKRKNQYIMLFISQNFVHFKIYIHLKTVYMGIMLKLTHVNDWSPIILFQVACNLHEYIAIPSEVLMQLWRYVWFLAKKGCANDNSSTCFYYFYAILEEMATWSAKYKIKHYGWQQVPIIVSQLITQK